VFPVSVYAKTQGTEPQQSQDLPSIEIQSTTADAIDIIVRFPSDPLFVTEPDNPEGAVFDEKLYSHPAEIGVPDLPVLREDVEVPAGDNYDIQILDSKSYAATLGEGNLPSAIPDRAPEVEKCSAGLACNISDPALILQSDGLFPNSPVELVNTYIVRGHQIVQLQFWPVQYDQVNQTVEIFQEISLRINITGSDTRSTLVNAAAYSSSAFENLLSSSVLNYSQQTTTETTRSTGGEGFLIIAPDAFTSTLSPLVSLKESQGFSVTVAGLSTTGSSADSIKAYIQSAYTNWLVPPTYVLLVGDVDNGSNTMPAFIGASSQTVTDLYYGTVDGADWIPDVFVGRLPARSTAQLTTIINNLTAYNNLTGTEEWVKKAALLASNDSNYWDFAEATQNYVIQNHTQPAGYTGTFPSSPQAGGDKLYAYTYNAGNTNVVSAINDNRSLISYTGHGSRTSWGGPYYNQSNIRSISNTNTFSVVTSFACITGDFNLEESFGETWVLQPNKGAVAFIGSSSSSFWGPDDIMERAMMDSLYSGTNSANIVGSFRFAGLMAVEESRPGTGTAQSRYYWESYNLLGDPSLGMVLGPKNVADYRPSLNTSSISAGQAPGQEITVHLQLTNAGLNPDTYSITLTSSLWIVSMQTRSVIALAPGETTTLEISVTVPADAQFGQIEQILLSVTSQNDPESPPAKDEATIELMASMMSFIPIVSKN
jgi:hypothetical protein